MFRNARSKAKFAPETERKRLRVRHEEPEQRPAPDVKNLAFGELESPARALLTVLLTFMRTRVARKQPELFQP